MKRAYLVFVLSLGLAGAVGCSSPNPTARSPGDGNLPSDSEPNPADGGDVHRQSDAGNPLDQLALVLKGADTNAVWLLSLSDGIPTGAPHILDTYSRARALSKVPGQNKAWVAFARSTESVDAIVQAFSLSAPLSSGAALSLGQTRSPTALAHLSAAAGLVAVIDSAGEPAILSVETNGATLATSGEAPIDEAPVEMLTFHQDHVLAVQSVVGVRQVRTVYRPVDTPVLGPVAALEDGPIGVAAHPLLPKGYAGVPEPTTADEINGLGLIQLFVLDGHLLSVVDAPVLIDQRAVDLAVSPGGHHLAFTHEIREIPPGGVVEVVVGYALGTRALTPEGSISEANEPTVDLVAHDVVSLTYTNDQTLALVTASRDEQQVEVFLLHTFVHQESKEGLASVGAPMPLSAAPIDMALVPR